MYFLVIQSTNPYKLLYNVFQCIYAKFFINLMESNTPKILINNLSLYSPRPYEWIYHYKMTLLEQNGLCKLYLLYKCNNQKNLYWLSVFLVFKPRYKHFNEIPVIIVASFILCLKVMSGHSINCTS